MVKLDIATSSPKKQAIADALLLSAQGDVYAAQEIFIKNVEGYIQTASDIGDGVITIGYGFNMGKPGEHNSNQTKAAKQLWDSVFNNPPNPLYVFAKYKSGKTPLSEADSLKLLRAEIVQRNDEIDGIDSIYKQNNIGSARKTAILWLYRYDPALIAAGTEFHKAVSDAQNGDPSGWHRALTEILYSSITHSKTTLGQLMSGLQPKLLAAAMFKSDANLTLTDRQFLQVLEYARTVISNQGTDSSTYDLIVNVHGPAPTIFASSTCPINLDLARGNVRTTINFENIRITIGTDASNQFVIEDFPGTQVVFPGRDHDRITANKIPDAIPGENSYCFYGSFGDDVINDPNGGTLFFDGAALKGTAIELSNQKAPGTQFVLRENRINWLVSRTNEDGKMDAHGTSWKIQKYSGDDISTLTLMDDPAKFGITFVRFAALGRNASTTPPGGIDIFDGRSTDKNSPGIDKNGAIALGATGAALFLFVGTLLCCHRRRGAMPRVPASGEQVPTTNQPVTTIGRMDPSESSGGSFHTESVNPVRTTFSDRLLGSRAPSGEGARHDI